MPANSSGVHQFAGKARSYTGNCKQVIMTVSEFFNMGGYAFYVWTSYALAGVILLANVLMPMLNARKQRRELIGKLRREGSV